MGADVIRLENGERLRRRSERPFGAALRELLTEADITTPIGNPDWAGFAKRAGVNYESLRKSVAGERPMPPRELIVAVAGELAVDPLYFVEYRLMEARRRFDPREVGYEEAVRNLERWADEL
jgi:transcriptional regulator with XRE-family HTH domain